MTGGSPISGNPHMILGSCRESNHEKRLGIEGDDRSDCMCIDKWWLVGGFHPSIYWGLSWSMNGKSAGGLQGHKNSSPQNFAESESRQSRAHNQIIRYTSYAIAMHDVSLINQASRWRRCSSPGKSGWRTWLMASEQFAMRNHHVSPLNHQTRRG